MTLVIGKRDAYNHSFTMMADKRIIGGSSGIKDTANKIIKLDNILLGIAGDYIPMELINELYLKWKAEKMDIGFSETIIEIVDLLEYIKDNSNIKSCQTMFMVLTRELGFIYMESGSIEMMDWKKNNEGTIAMGDSSKLVYALEDISNDKSLALSDWDYFDIISSLDSSVSQEYLTLSISNI